MPFKTCPFCVAQGLEGKISVPSKRSTLRQHMLQEHPEQQAAQENLSNEIPPFRCAHCEVLLTAPQPYLQHLLEVHDLSFSPTGMKSHVLIAASNALD